MHLEFISPAKAYYIPDRHAAAAELLLEKLQCLLFYIQEGICSNFLAQLYSPFDKARSRNDVKTRWQKICYVISFDDLLRLQLYIHIVSHQSRFKGRTLLSRVCEID